MPPEEFPAIPKIEGGITIKINAQDLADSIKKTEFAAAQDEARPVLAGVLFEIEKKGISLVATDGYRLSYSQIVSTKEERGVKIIIPSRPIAEVSKIISENIPDPANSQIVMTVADQLNQVNFKTGEVEFTSRLIEGEYPNWQKIIPQTFASKIKIKREEFIKQVRIGSIFAREAGNIIKLKFEGKTMIISAQTGQLGSNEIETDVELIGKGGEIAFNFRYLLEALSVIDDDDVCFEMSESLTPGKLTGADKKTAFFHIIMPVRLQS